MILCIKYRFTQLAQDIKFDISVDGICLQTQLIDGQQHAFRCIVDEDVPRSSHMILEMSGKSSHHTVLDKQGNIEFDCATLIDSILFDDIDVTDIYCQGLQCYQHDNNGNSSKFIDEFYGFMGCNGKVRIEFELPIYKWFLKHCE
jgi:hypothetical protein